MFLVAPAQAQTANPVPDVSMWQLLGFDVPFLVMNLFVLFIFIVVIATVRWRYGRFFRIQREALDHRKVADAQVIAQNQSIEQLIAQQYGVVNAHNQLVLARAEDALRLSTVTLAQITSMNESIARIADRLDRFAGAPG